jgi:hypothetical protein
MFIYQVVSHTPLWVWILLAFLIWRGLNAMQPRQIAPSRALIIPVVFLVWGLSGLLGSHNVPLDLGLFVVAAALGYVGGGALARLTATPGLATDTGMLAMPGSAIPLAMIVIDFVLKYSGTVAVAMASDPATQSEAAAAVAVIGGLFAGLFWGRTLGLFRRALRGAGRSDDWAALTHLALARPAP